MVKHIVLFKLKKELTQTEREDVMHRFKAAIEALPATIPFIRHIVKAYSAHPDHQAAAGLLKEYKQDRACVDYML